MTGPSSQSELTPRPAWVIRPARPDPLEINKVSHVWQRIFVETFAPYVSDRSKLEAYSTETLSPQQIKYILDERSDERDFLLAVKPFTFTGSQKTASSASEATNDEIVGLLRVDSAPLPLAVSYQNDPRSTIYDFTHSSLHIRSLFVDSSEHGGGLARAFLHGAVERAQSDGVKLIWLSVVPENLRAVKFYQKVGFRKIGATEFTWGFETRLDDVYVLQMGSC